MKRQLIFGVAFTTLLTASAVFAGGPEIIEPDYFSGFFVGGTVAMHSMTTDQNADYNFGTAAGSFLSVPFVIVPPSGLQEAVAPSGHVDLTSTIGGGTIGSMNVDGGSLDVYGGVQAGFGKVFNHQWYLGIVGFWEGGSQDATANSQQQNTFVSTGTASVISSTNPSRTDVFFATNGASNVNLSSTTSIDNDYGVAAKLGYVITPTTLIYGKVGAIWANITASSSVNGSVLGTSTATVVTTDTGGTVTQFGPEAISGSASVNGSASSEDTEISLLLGAGIEQFLYQDIVSLNFEYNYANFGTVTAGPVPVTASNVVVNGVLQSNTTVGSLSSSGNAKISTFLAGLNFYFGHDWI